MSVELIIFIIIGLAGIIAIAYGLRRAPSSSSKSDGDLHPPHF